jgi:hypothetical protein
MVLLRQQLPPGRVGGGVGLNSSLVVGRFGDCPSFETHPTSVAFASSSDRPMASDSVDPRCLISSHVANAVAEADRRDPYRTTQQVLALPAVQSSRM